jgi:hypothetical protein
MLCVEALQETRPHRRHSLLQLQPSDLVAYCTVNTELYMSILTPVAGNSMWWYACKPGCQRKQRAAGDFVGEAMLQRHRPTALWAKVALECGQDEELVHRLAECVHSDRCVVHACPAERLITWSVEPAARSSPRPKIQHTIMQTSPGFTMPQTHTPMALFLPHFIELRAQSQEI